MFKFNFWISLSIKYTSTQFNNYKHNIKKEKIIESKIEDLLNDIQYENENLLKVEYKFKSKENKLEKIKIYGTFISLNLLKDKNINQYFVDGTYKVVPYNNEFKCLLIWMGFKYRLNLYQLSLVALLTSETSETSEIYTKFFIFLNIIYEFEPKLISCDFGKGNLKNFKNIYGEDNKRIITCFFHLTQAWWKKANSLNLRNKKYIKTTKVLIFN